MMNDPVITNALSIMIFAFVLTLAVLALFFWLMFPKKSGKAAAPTKTSITPQIVLAIVIGILVPAGILIYALFYSPLATMTPEKMHHLGGVSKQTPDEKLRDMGKSLFRLHCASCHGPEGNAPRGKGANLTARIAFNSALLNIQKGANNFKRTFPGGMPPMISDTDRAAQVANYVASGFTENRRGRMLYEMLHCARCHGEDGRGREFLGPNIREFDLKTVALVLKNGKNGVIGKMPRFEKFTEKQVRALGLYVISLQKPRPQTFQD
jgi:mono/diheme cytochrome c family protein